MDMPEAIKMIYQGGNAEVIEKKSRFIGEIYPIGSEEEAQSIVNQIRKKHYDAIITHEPSPITQLIPAIVLGKIRNVKVYSWIMDIWPDSVVSSMGESKISRIMNRILNAVTNWTYRGSDKLLITSKGMADLINRNADYSDKIIYFPNWSDDLKAMPIEKIPSLPEGYKIMMAGNISDGG